VADQVVIVGAGLTGLVTAYQLHRRGVPSVVLEADDRPGGRVATVRFADGAVAEGGMEEFWESSPAYPLLQELGLPLMDQPALSSVMLRGCFHPFRGGSAGAYFDELGGRFNAGFDPSQSISASDDEMSLPEGLLLVATLQGDPVGCGALKLHSDTGIGEVKRMWVSQSVRGLGLGRRLLETLAGEASSRGMHTLRLETNETLSEARHLYETSGFVEVEAFNDEPYAHHWFQRDLTNAPTRRAETVRYT